MSLTPKQTRFVEEYLLDLNATQAARRAGYSEHTANEQGSQLLANLSIQEALAAAIRERKERTNASADQVLRELMRVAFSDMRDFAEWGPDGVKLRPSPDLPADMARCVVEVSQSKSETGGSIRFKLHNKLAALELLGRHIGLFPNRHEHSGKLEYASLTDAELDRRIAAAQAQLRESPGREGPPPQSPPPVG